jgi:hypothetical protein
MTTTKMNSLFKQIANCNNDIQSLINKKVLINYVNQVGGINKINLNFMNSKILTIVRNFDKDIDLLYNQTEDLRVLIENAVSSREILRSHNGDMLLLKHKFMSNYFLDKQYEINNNILIELIRLKISEMTGLEYEPIQEHMEITEKWCQKQIKILNNEITDYQLTKVFDYLRTCNEII